MHGSTFFATNLHISWIWGTKSIQRSTDNLGRFQPHPTYHQSHIQKYIHNSYVYILSVFLVRRLDSCGRMFGCMFWNFERMNGSVLFWVWVQKFSFQRLYWNTKKTIQNYLPFWEPESDSQNGSRRRCYCKSKWGVAIAPILGSRNDSQNGGRIVCFFEGIAWHLKAEFDNLQAQVFEFWVEPSVGKVCLA